MSRSLDSAECWWALVRSRTTTAIRLSLSLITTAALLSILSACADRNLDNALVQPPDDIASVEAAIARQPEAAVAIMSAFMANQAPPSRPPFVDPAVGPQFIPFAGKRPYPSSGWIPFRLRFRVESTEGWETDLRSRIDLRRPQFEWWEGWQLYEEKAAPGGPEGVYDGIVWFPEAWGCAEIRMRFQGTFVDEETIPQETQDSNVLVAGDCPDPMPSRAPLAVPEAGFHTGLGAAVIMLACLGSSHRASKCHTEYPSASAQGSSS